MLILLKLKMAPKVVGKPNDGLKICLHVMFCEDRHLMIAEERKLMIAEER